jgi:competence protein ComEA
MKIIGLKKLLVIGALQCAVMHSAFALQVVNINKADAAVIAESLQNVGESKAKAIVDYRTKNGPFKTVADLGNVKGIGDKTLEKNKQYIQLK